MHFQLFLSIFLLSIQFAICGKFVGEKEQKFVIFKECPNRGIHRRFEKEKIAKCLEEGRKNKEGNEELWAKFRKMPKNAFEMGGLEIDEQLFEEFLSDEKNAEKLAKVFIYLSQLAAEPICLTPTTIESIGALGAKGKYFEEKIKNGATKSRNLRRKEEGENEENERAFIFWGKGIEEILVEEEGLECAESLLEPRKVTNLMQKIVLALKSGREGGLDLEGNLFGETVEIVMNSLGEGKMGKWEAEMREKWREIQSELGAKEIRKDLKKFAIWLFTPMHMENLIQILLFLTDLDRPIEITLETLRLFGMEDIFVKAMEKLGAKMVADGGKKAKIGAWIFGPNGFVPLFLRDGEEAEEGAEEEFEEKVEEQRRKLRVRKMEKEEEIEFMKKIMEEVIEHKGKPMHELMDHLLGKMGEMEGKMSREWGKHLERMKTKWGEMKGRSAKENLKKFGLWLVTPERINNLLRLIFALTDLKVPVYLTLETLDAFGITDLFLKEMKLGSLKMEEFYKKHPQAKELTKFVEFMIGKDGVIPVFLGDGELAGNEDRKLRLKNEADIIEIVAEVLTNRGGAEMLFADLYSWLVEFVQSKEFYYQAVHRFNEFVQEHHAKLKAKGILKEGPFGGFKNWFEKFFDKLARKMTKQNKNKIHRQSVESSGKMRN